MRIAVVGSGIAGLASAWLLSRRHDVTLFEANSYFGGHTHTHEVEQAGTSYRIDSGFIVHNPAHYPLLTRMFAQLGVASQPTTDCKNFSPEPVKPAPCMKVAKPMPRLTGLVGFSRAKRSRLAS